VQHEVFNDVAAALLQSEQCSWEDLENDVLNNL
jgi:hypothetical protein